MVIAVAAQANTDSYKDMETLKLTVPEMKAELGTATTENYDRSELALKAPEAKMDFAFFKSRTNPNTKAYKFMDDMTFVGVPLFIAGIIAKSEKNAFKQQTKHSLVTKFKTGIDDYTQFFGPAAVVGLKLGGYEGRSDWPRLLASAGMSYGLMALFVNTIKHTAKEMRPDGSTANSWPSGHTATAFVGATLLHKEYGLTRSPWWSVAGYGVATATGVMRVLNNRHWISDVLSGAGLGILSGELGYAICDLLFKGKGLLRNDIIGTPSVIDHPSFFEISMGIGFGSRDFDFEMKKYGWSEDLNMKFRASTAVAAEGAYFFNPYIGVGGRLRVKSTPIKGWDKIVDFGWEDVNDFFDNLEEEEQEALANNLDNIDFIIESDHLTEFSGDLGVYFNLPLSNRFALGSKLLIGRSIMQELDLNATVTGGKRTINLEDLTGDIADENVFVMAKPAAGTYTTEWDYFTLSCNNTMKFGTGISLTYAYKENYAWRLFLDYDYSRKTYTMTYNPAVFAFDAIGFGLGDETASFRSLMEPSDLDAFIETQDMKKNRHTFVLGGSFTISF